ncbi:E3 ubiquitin-protein ligase PRT6 [Euphorbia lathyris]|uniref:E3 ubiquitin-protein ligase PRT6 n=1 Tax=Euphorbia lathyris TaxID=212925 RepID=UPI0033144A2B
MDTMDIDSPAEPNPSPLKPRDRIMRRLAQLGVPEEYLQRRYLGFVAFFRDNTIPIPELVSTILPLDEEVADVLLESRSGSKKTLNPTMKHYFRECMVWIQWLMFLGEPAAALKNLAKISSGRGVCGSVWGNNDIAYRCRTCEHDPTCAICVPCFQNGNHKDHDYSIIYTGGGCCDCGDATAWKREGFCSKHKGTEQIQPLPEEYANSVGPVLDALFVRWKKKLVSAETIYQENIRANDGFAFRMKVANELTFVVVELLLEFCKHSESLLSFISRKVITLLGLLDILVRAERFLCEPVIKKLHELLLKLLGEPVFKYEFSKVFISYYSVVVHDVIKDDSEEALKKYPLLPTFSVQIFTVPTLTPRLVKEMNLLSMLLGCLGDIFDHCAGEDGHLRVTKWRDLYDIAVRVVEDIRFVTSHGVVPIYVTRDQRDILRTWMRLLYFLQGMCPLKREIGIHIDEENENMNLLFVLDHMVANIHSLLVDGAFSSGEGIDDNNFTNTRKQCMDEEDSTRHAKVGRLSQESSVCGVSGRSSAVVSEMQIAEVKSDASPLTIPLPVISLIYECLRAIDNWIRADSSGAPSSATSTSGSNFFSLKNTFSSIKKGKYIFGRFNSSNKDLSKRSSQPLYTGYNTSMDVEIANSIGQGQDCKPMVSSERDTICGEESVMEGDSSTELEAFQILSLSNWANISYNVSSEDVSLHIPLHRLLSLLLQRALKRCYSGADVISTTASSTVASSDITNDDFFGCVLGGCHPYGFAAYIMEHPLRNRVFCAEVHAGMWKKNGETAALCSEWYRSVRWSEQGLELDLFLLQCCAALAPADLYVNRIVERFGLSDYLALNPVRSSEYEPVLMQEMLTLIIQIVQERRFSGLSPAENLKRELIHKLAVGDATRSHLVKSLPRDLSKYDQLQEILDTVAVYSNPSGFNQGMYSMRWMYWKELDLYHPRWSSRDLQVTQERYIRYCGVSALTTQLPRWTKIHPPLNTVARIAICEVVVKIIRAVLFFAVFSDRLTDPRAPDGVLIMALHLLSLGLDISLQQSEPRDSIPILAFACEEIDDGFYYGAGAHSLLSLLVSLMRMHSRDNLDNFVEEDGCNISSLIERLLKKFAEGNAICMAKLQELAPEVVIHLLQPIPSRGLHSQGSASDNEKRKAKARARQAAILEKMKADQSKFLSSLNSADDDDSKSGVDESNTNNEQDIGESAEDVCSLCHDPKSKNPVSFLILLQKSRLLSLVERGPLSWDQVRQSGKEGASISANKMTDQAGINSSSSNSRAISANQLEQLGQNAVNEFADCSYPGELSNFVEFIKAKFPSLRNPQVLGSLKEGNDGTTSSFEVLEQDMYISSRKEIYDGKISISEVNNAVLSAAEGSKSCNGADSALLGKYIAAFSREMTEHPSSSENAVDVARTESTSQIAACDRFGPADCDGVYLSSCGHAVHQECLDRYLSSLKERYVRRSVFEGGHIVDPDQGEFLCPVCRRLANSVLPALPGDIHRIGKEPMISNVSSTTNVGHLLSSNEKSNLLLVEHALLLLRSTANLIEKGDFWKTFPLQRSDKTTHNLDFFYRVLFKMYFPNRLDKLSKCTRANNCMILWDTLKYTLVSMEIAARCDRTQMTPTYSLNGLYKELKSSTGFVLSLLLKVVQTLRSKNSLYVLQRFRGVQLFAESICSGVPLDHASSTYQHESDMSSILKHLEKDVPYPDLQFWNLAADPILAHDPFSSLMWVLFCLPHPFLSCEESLLSLMHIFYVVSVAQGILAYCGLHQNNNEQLGSHDCLISCISKVLGEYGWIKQYFISNYVDSNSAFEDVIRRLSFPYLRRCALLWKLLSSSVSEPFCNRDNELDGPSYAIDDTNVCMDADMVELYEVQKLEKIFKIPPLDVVLKDQVVQSLVSRWLQHFRKKYEIHRFQYVLRSMPAVPFKLLQLPHVYQDLLQRYIKHRCDCKNVIEEPALCLLCGKLYYPSWKACNSCRRTENTCEAHAVDCGAGIGVFLLIKKTTILLQRCVRQATWPSPYLDAFGEEDFEMRRGKPLYLNEERYAALTYMVASHGLDRSTKAPGQTTIGHIFLV